MRNLRHALAFVIAAVVGGTAAFSQSITQDSQSVVLAKLSGYAEVARDVTLTSRYTPADRRITRDYLAALFSELGLTPARHVYRVDGENVHAALAPTEEPAGNREAVVLGAHFDSVRRSPGANDNATGIAMVNEVLRALSTEACRTRAVLVAYFDEEESGLVGSRHFAAWLGTQDFEVHSVHTVDQMGWDGDRDRAIELELPTPELRALYQRHAAAIGVRAHVTSTDSTDHQSFRSAGFAAVGLTEEYVNGDTTPHYHRATDTYQTVDLQYLASSTRLMTAAVRELVVEGCP